MSHMTSYAQNREDVVLWRALGHIANGRYVEVGANHPSHDSVTRTFYDSEWSGITVEPVPHFADLQRTERPRDTLIEAVITSTPGEITLHVIPDTGLSTIVDGLSDRHEDAGIDHVDLVVPSIRLDTVLANNGRADEDIHFMVIDVEGAEAEVLASIDLKAWRPWVLVVEATAPTSTEPTHGEWEPALLANGYEFCLFDGLSRFYVAAEKADELRADLSYSASVFDDYELFFSPTERDELTAERSELIAEVTHWRTLALTGWADAVTRDIGQAADIKKLGKTLKSMQTSASWRLTRPLRGMRRALSRDGSP